MIEVHVNMENIQEEDSEVLVSQPKKNKHRVDTGRITDNTDKVIQPIKIFKMTADNFNTSNKVTKNKTKSNTDVDNLKNGRVMNPIDSPTKDFFMRKTEENFIKNSLSPMKNGRILVNSPAVTTRNHYNTFVNVMKTDIIQIDNLIKKYSNILTYHKQPNKNFNLKLFNTSLNGGSSISLSNSNYNFQKKISEIEKNNKINISDFFQKISENSKSLENLMKEFNAKSKDELVYNLALELYYSRLFISKTNDLTFLFNLKYSGSGDTNSVSSETISRFHQLKIFLEKIIEKESKNNFNSDRNSSMGTSSRIFNYQQIEKTSNGENSQRSELLSPLILNKQESSSANIIEEEDVTRILDFHTVSELLKFETKNKIINHIKRLCVQLNDKAYQIFSNFISKIVSDEQIQYKLRKTDDIIENFILMRKMIEDMFSDIQIKNEKLSKELQEIKLENEKMSNLVREVNKRDMTSLINHIIEENNKLQDNIKEIETNGKVKLYEEITKIYCKMDEFTIQNQTLKDENTSLQSQINLFTKKNYRIFRDKKGNIITDPNESFELLLQEQFTKMKDAFTLKLTNMKNEITKLKYSSEKEITKLTDELNLNKTLNELFANQIVMLKQNFRNIK